MGGNEPKKRDGGASIFPKLTREVDKLYRKILIFRYRPEEKEKRSLSLKRDRQKPNWRSLKLKGDRASAGKISDRASAGKISDRASAGKISDRASAGKISDRAELKSKIQRSRNGMNCVHTVFPGDTPDPIGGILPAKPPVCLLLGVRIKI